MVKSKTWQEEMDVKVGLTRDRMQERNNLIKDVQQRNLNFTNIPRNDQLLPPQVQEYMENGMVLEPSEKRPGIQVPLHYYGFSSGETQYIINTLQQSSDMRLRKLLNQVHTRALFKEDRYYQIVDNPDLYMKSAMSKFETPVFNPKSILYLTAVGLAVYLKNEYALRSLCTFSASGIIPRAQSTIKNRANRQAKRKFDQSIFEAANEFEDKKKEKMVPMFNIDAYQYGTFVHSEEGDITRFQLDYLAFRRDYSGAMSHLLQLGYRPNSPTLLLYRRRYFQYATPFLDWVDLCRYLMKKNPTMTFINFYKEMLLSGNENVRLGDLKYLGRIMLECFELRKLNKSNCKTSSFWGIYVGRKILKDKEPQTHADYKEAFGKGQAVRPVIPHACSPMRRFLTHVYYYDKNSMSTLSQVLACARYMLSVDFFMMHPIVKRSTIHKDPIIFQIYDFVWFIRKNNIQQGMYLRNESYDTIEADPEASAWYRRWDVLNCVSLLFGICQNAILKDLNDVTVDNIVKLILEVLISSEYLESVLSYSFYDTYFGLTSTTNCVPNLQSRCVLRVLKKAPLYLVEAFAVPQIIGFFSPRFWKPSGGDSNKTKVPQTIEEIGEYLVLRNRKLSMKTATEGGGEAVSGTSAMGAGGAVTLFYRNFDSMIEISAEDEQAMDNDRNDNTRKEEEERVHVNDYKRQEIDYRYSQIFTDSFFQSMGRPRIFFDETVQYKLSVQRSREIFKPKDQ